MQISNNAPLVTTATTLASMVSLGVSVIREVSGDAISNVVNGVNIHTDRVLSDAFSQILKEELMLNSKTRLPS